MADFVPRLSVIGAEIEATKGTEETLVAADIGAVIADPEAEDRIDLIERNFLSAGLSKFAPLIGKKERRIRFESELKGSGTAGTPPKINDYLEGCGMTVTNVASTSDTYAFNNGDKTLTIARWLVPTTGTAVKKTIKGAMGAWQLQGNIGDAVRIIFDFLGQYVNVVDGDPPSGITYDTAKPPQLLQATFTVGGFSPRISNITINGGQQVNLPDDLTEAHGKGPAYIAARDGEVTFDALMENVSDHDWFGRLRDGTEGALVLTVGSVAGNRFTVNCPKLQYVDAREGERDNAAVVQITARMNRDSGDNDDTNIVFD